MQLFGQRLHLFIGDIFPALNTADIGAAIVGTGKTDAIDATVAEKQLQHQFTLLLKRRRQQLNVKLIAIFQRNSKHRPAKIRHGIELRQHIRLKCFLDKIQRTVGNIQLAPF